MRSVEQAQEFQFARRIAALVAPGWRLLATPVLKPDQLAIDLRKRTIELGEDSKKENLLAGAMFAVGYVRLHNRTRFAELFGRGLEKYSDNQSDDLVAKLAKQGSLADRYASKWANSALVAFWPAMNCDDALRLYASRRQDWVRYFSDT
jgi:hypothetical protein